MRVQHVFIVYMKDGNEYKHHIEGSEPRPMNLQSVAEILSKPWFYFQCLRDLQVHYYQNKDVSRVVYQGYYKGEKDFQFAVPLPEENETDETDETV